MKRLAEQKDDNSRSNDNADDDLGGLDYRTIACTSPTQLTAVKPAELQVWEREITKQYGGRERERERRFYVYLSRSLFQGFRCVCSSLFFSWFD